MSNNTNNAALALTAPKGPVALASVNPMDAAQHFIKSGYFRDVADMSKAVVKIMYGQEFGIAPVSAMLNIYIVEGKPSMSAHMIGAVLRKAGYDFRVRVNTNEECEIAYIRGNEILGNTSFTWGDAVKAGLSNKDNWKKYPKAMLFARAMSQGARTHCPDAFMGVIYTPDELGAEVEVNEQGGLLTVRDVTPAAGSSEPAQPAYAFEGQIEEIKRLGAALGQTEEQLLAWLKCEWAELPSAMAAKAIIKLQDRLDAQNQATDAGAGAASELTDDAETRKLKDEIANHAARLGLSRSQEVAMTFQRLMLPEQQAGTELTNLQRKRVVQQLRKFKSYEDVEEWISLKQDEARHAALETAQARARESGEPLVKAFNEDEMLWANPGAGNQPAKPGDAIFGEGAAETDPDSLPF